MNPQQVDAYLARIGVERPVRADAQSLQRLQKGHLFAVPFENLSIHLGEPIGLEEGVLFDKIVGQHRGGFCYELNGAFAELLKALGFTVTLLAARVHDSDGLGPVFDHLALRVDAGNPWLADVGFGRFSAHPLRLDDRTDQRDREGIFRITEHESGDLEVALDGEPQYRIEQRPRTLADFEPTCWWQQTSPKSHFTQSTVCTLLTESGRVTLSGRTLIETGAGKRRERPLTDDAELLAAYRTYFGIALDRVPLAATQADPTDVFTKIAGSSRLAQAPENLA